jgi:hypothetical protein
MSKSDRYIACATELPPEGEVVMTKIDNEFGVGAERPLQHFGGQWWWTPNGEWHVLYRPTHWKRLTASRN